MKLLPALALAAALACGCGMVEDMKGMFEKAQAVSKAIKDKHGWDTQVGWNVHNGKLTQVTVTFHAREVREQRVAVLEGAAVEAIAKVFGARPETVNIQVATQPGN
jgi:major membrane immunogen (membrane-anchored lipoprotein)